MKSSYPNKKFIEAVDSKDKSEFDNRFFRVVYEDIPKPDSGIWVSYYSFYGCRHTTTISLDEEDIEYLYNKYKSKAVEEIKLEEQDKKEKREKEIKEVEEKLRKLKVDE